MLNPLLTLKRILQESARAADRDEMVKLMAAQIKKAMSVDVCSLYLLSPEKDLKLSATEGLDNASVGKIRMPFGQGLVGTVALTQHSLNMERGDQHPKFLFFEQTGEERFKGFLGVPLIYHGDTIGVLVVQVYDPRKFTDEEEAFLVTMAAHLAGTLGSGVINSNINAQESNHAVQRLIGIKGAPGIAFCRVKVVKDEVDINQIPTLYGEYYSEEKKRLDQAVAETLDDLEAQMGNMDSSAGATLDALLEVYRMLLASPELKTVFDEMLEQGYAAETALRDGFLRQVDVFEAMEDPYLRSKAEDLRVLAGKLYRRLTNNTSSRIMTDTPVILAGRLVSVSHFGRIDSNKLAGVISKEGSALSHTGVLANALGIPAVMGLEDLNFDNIDNQDVIVDGNRGIVILNPPEPVVLEYQRLLRQAKALDADLAPLKNLPAETLDGEKVSLLTNTGLLADISPGLERGAEGVGLYRSEIPFMVHHNFPTEEEQQITYRGVLGAYAPKPVTMRILDIGGDKPLPYFPITEENPFLGWRGIRFTLDYTNIMLEQLRAMMLASRGHDNLKIMIPMFSREDELHRFLQIFELAITQLRDEGRDIQRPQVGVMIEVPSAIWLISRVRDQVDFISIGSNDLTQYLLAVDRNNSRVASLYDSLHPSVLMALKFIILEANRLKLPVSLCGEMAGDPVSVVLLLAMGLRKLSMSAYKIPRIKSLIRHLDINDCQNVLDDVLKLSDEKLMRQRVEDFIKGLGLTALLGV
ncbi:phosphoenolpyruvate--protein phosphotransferase [Gynuella sp.]|uniref:phosphoenolpyruvate--protein phosphotransferase n=1 Tax=Gynuella sp. TaxID=2969146 RepID=UPI003D0B585B